MLWFKPIEVPEIDKTRRGYVFYYADRQEFVSYPRRVRR